MHSPPPLGFGLGLRKEHFADLLATPPAGVDWFEAISENFMVAGGKPLAVLDAVRARYPVALHGVSLSIGAPAGPDPQYLRDLARLARRVAMTASAWLHAEADTETYRHFVAATDEWDAYAAPQLEEPAEELLDQLADHSAPLALGEVAAEVTAQIRRAARRGS